jgi:probable rRNA maturation factor
MDISLQIDQPFLAEVDPKPIEKALQTTWQRFDKPAFQTAMVVITDNQTLQQLNHQHRGVNAPTDVLSFENSPDPDFPDLDQGHLGDIIIAYPMAEAQALAAGHPPIEELTLLAVHGMLHLLGFDHDTPTSKKKMWTTQHQIMTELGLAHVQPTED